MKTTNKKFCVYKHTSPSGKVYIGITSQKPQDRWQNGKGYKRNEHFTNAILKYGWDNFKHEILLTDLTHKKACWSEKKLIALYQSNCSKYGYNRSEGGEKTMLGCKLPPMTQEHRDKISQKAKGRPSQQRKAILMYDLDGNFIREFESIASASEFIGCKKENSHLSHVCRAKGNSKYHNYQWKYKGDTKVIGVYKDNREMKVYQYTKDGEFVREWQSGREASRFYKTDVSKVCVGKRKTASGFIWSYFKLK